MRTWRPWISFLPTPVIWENFLHPESLVFRVSLLPLHPALFSGAPLFSSPLPHLILLFFYSYHPSVFSTAHCSFFPLFALEIWQYYVWMFLSLLLSISVSVSVSVPHCLPTESVMDRLMDPRTHTLIELRTSKLKGMYFEVKSNWRSFVSPHHPKCLAFTRQSRPDP